MCQFCNPNQVLSEPADASMGNKRSFTFFSVAAIEEAIRQTSGGCTPICDHHRALLEASRKETEEEAEDDPDEGDCCDNDEDYDGT